MPTAKKTYIITPTSGEAPYEVKAETYEFESTTGRHLFKTGDQLVANLINVSVREAPAS